LVNELGSLSLGAGDDDAFSEERFVLEPVGEGAFFDDVTDDDDGGGAEVVFLRKVGKGGESAVDRLLSRGRGPANNRGGGVGRFSAVDELLADDFDPCHAHVETEGAGGVG